MAAEFPPGSVAARHWSLSDHRDLWPGLLDAATPARPSRQMSTSGKTWTSSAASRAAARDAADLARYPPTLRSTRPSARYHATHVTGKTARSKRSDAIVARDVGHRPP